MKIWTLTENTAVREDLTAEHGLSLYIEACGKKILFDAGQSGAFWENAAKMGIDLTGVDFGVLSHGHYDHGGGMKTFLQKNSHAPVYVSEYAFGAYYNAQNRYIGLEQSMANHPRVIPAGENQKLADGITLISCRDRKPVVPMDSAGLQKMKDDGLVPDDFIHEQYLMIEEEGLCVAVSGCSHRGILNIREWLPCHVLIGGFHFMKKDPESPELRAAAERLLEGDARYYTCHCTGQAQYGVMKQIMGSRLQYLAAGDFIELRGTP